ncbi:MAG: haloacid dehalogenase-like hydrolase [Burkholderiaceae bacterium]|jgi:HAD superfamily phosphoserine phosphatase-like hydrolase|nr:haloacid dehalogenase-like hydrolase [Burkholderiaceae bacterium]
MDPMETACGIVAFDLDGTLLRGPTVCEVLAESLGRLQEMRRFESFTHESDIVAARQEMARWFAEKPVSTLLRCLEGARWAPSAKEAIARLQARGIDVVILSITWVAAVEWFAAQLGVVRFLGTQHLPNGEIVHVFGRDKARYLRELIATTGVPRDRVAAVGDTHGDVDMLREASMRFFVGKEAPSLESVYHLPDADLTLVADRILETWAV